MKTIKRMLMQAGLCLPAIQLEVDKVDTLPEYQRPWYVQDTTTGKFKLDPAKVEVEDVTGLRNTVAATRREVAEAKAEAERRVREALAPFDGLDPKKVKEIMAQFASDEERQLIEKGHIDQVITKRMEKAKAEFERQAQEAKQREEGALEVATTYMERVLDNQVRAAAMKAGMHAAAVEDALLRARLIFSLDDEGNARQFADDGETPVQNKKADGPFTVEDWIEERRVDCPHWFVNGNSGGGARGGQPRGGAPDLSGLSPTQRLTAAREAKAAGGRK